MTDTDKAQDEIGELIEWLKREADDFDEGRSGPSPKGLILFRCAAALEAYRAENARLQLQLQEMILERDEALREVSAVQRSLLKRMAGITEPSEHR